MADYRQLCRRFQILRFELTDDATSSSALHANALALPDRSKRPDQPQLGAAFLAGQRFENTTSTKRFPVSSPLVAAIWDDFSKARSVDPKKQENSIVGGSHQ
jgi:hypothetical protein